MVVPVSAKVVVVGFEIVVFVATVPVVESGIAKASVVARSVSVCADPVCFECEPVSDCGNRKVVDVVTIDVEVETGPENVVEVDPKIVGVCGEPVKVVVV